MEPNTHVTTGKVTTDGMLHCTADGVPAKEERIYSLILNEDLPPGFRLDADEEVSLTAFHEDTGEEIEVSAVIEELMVGGAHFRELQPGEDVPLR
jgi:hypothetical protein